MVMINIYEFQVQCLIVHVYTSITSRQTPQYALPSLHTHHLASKSFTQANTVLYDTKIYTIIVYY